MAATKEELERLYVGERLSLREVAKQLRRPYPTVEYWFRRAGVQLRSRSAARSLAYITKPSLYQSVAERLRKTCYRPGARQDPVVTAKRVATRRANGDWHSASTRAKIGEAHRGRPATAQQIEHLHAAFRKSRMTKPTSIERAVIGFITQHRLPYRYVGDGYTWIAGRCPDFLRTDAEKVVVEVFGRWWHDPSLGNPLLLPQHLIGNTVYHYAKYGFRCIVIWEEETKNPRVVLDKLCCVAQGDA